MKQSRLHFWLTILWVVLILPTVLWWKDSILWVSLMSWYAIVVSHLSAYYSAKTEEKVEKKLEKPSNENNIQKVSSSWRRETI